MSNLTDEIRAEMRQRVTERGTKYWLEFDEADAIDLAAGFVPASVRATFLSMISWLDDDRRAAARTDADQQKKKRRTA